MCNFLCLQATPVFLIYFFFPLQRRSRRFFFLNFKKKERAKMIVVSQSFHDSTQCLTSCELSHALSLSESSRDHLGDGFEHVRDDLHHGARPPPALLLAPGGRVRDLTLGLVLPLLPLEAAAANAVGVVDFWQLRSGGYPERRRRWVLGFFFFF